MPGSALSGLSEGLWGSIDQTRAENQRLEDERSRNERSILTTLMNADDPKVRSYAIAGLLDAASPKRRLKGMGGLLGEFESNPSVQAIHDYLTTPQTTVTPGLPSRSVAPSVASQATPAPIANPGTAALPSTSPVTGGPVGHPPPRPAMAGPPPPVASPAFTVGHPPPAVGRTDTSLPQAFESPEERYASEARGKAQGDVEGDIAGYMALGVPREQAVAQVMEERKRRGMGGAYQGVVDGGMVPEGTVDVYGRPVVKGQQYRSVNGQLHPVVSPATSRPFKVLQMPDGSPGLYRINPDMSKEFVGAVPKGMTAVHVTHEDGSEEIIQVPKEFQTPEAATPSPQPTGGPQGGAGAQPSPQPVAGGTPAATAPKPAPAPIQTKPPTLKPVTVKTAEGKIVPALQTHDGRFLDARDRKTELPGAAEVPNSANLEKPLSADAKKTLESVDTMLPMMDRVEAALGERGTDPNEGWIKQGMQILHAKGQSAEYSMGMTPGDPAYRELIPLIANLKVLATSTYLHGVRNMQYIQQIQSHMPDVGDSPSLIRQKLAQMRPTLQSIVKSVHEVEGGGPNPVGGGGAGQDPRIGKIGTGPDGRRGVVTGLDPSGNLIVDYSQGR